MQAAKMQFEILSQAGFRAIALVTQDDLLLLAPGVSPRDLPGQLGTRVRERLARGELATGQMNPLA